jgi:transposase
VDVSAATLEVAWHEADERVSRETFANDAAGHRELIRTLTRRKRRRVVLEATGIYSLDLALALDRAEGFEVMVANPWAVSSFARALMQRSKTDRVDAVTLLLFAERMPFTSWVAPRPAAFELRTLTRRVMALVEMKSAEKNRAHVAGQSKALSRLLDKSVARTLKMLEREIELLREAAREIIQSDPLLARWFELLNSVKGIGPNNGLQISAVQIS